MIKLIIFDFDGVIIKGSNKSYFICYHKALEDVGIHLNPAQERKRLLEIWGRGYQLQLKHLLKEKPSLVPKAIKAYEKYYYSPLFTENVKLIKNADTVLRQLAKSYKLALATGMGRKHLNFFLSKFKIANNFKLIVSSHDITNPENKKPSPFILNQIMKKLAVKNSGAVYVGDAETDVQMANNAQVTPIVVLTGLLTKRQAHRLKIQHVIPDITHLPKLLKNPQ